MKKKIKKYRVSMDSTCEAISFVSEPAIEVEAIALEKQEEEKQQVFLESEEKYLFVSPILIPDKDIYRNNGETEYYLNFGANAIEKLSQDYLKGMRQKNITLQHNEAVDEGVSLVESWVVYDEYQDKAHALGFSVPKGTWMGAFKVDSIDVWNRIKSGELRGVSVEAMVGLEDFSAQEEKSVDFDNVSFGELKDAIRNMVKDVLSEKTEEVVMEETPVAEPVVEEPIQTPAEPQISPVEPSNPAEVIESTPEPKEEPTEPVNDLSHLNELIESMKSEIEALKALNGTLNEKVKTLEAEPSAKPIVTNAGAKGNSYDNWREQMKTLIGR